MSTPSTKIIPAVSRSPQDAPDAVISSGSPFSPWKMFSGGTPTAWASCEWIRTRLKSPWTGITYLGRVRLSISFSSS